MGIIGLSFDDYMYIDLLVQKILVQYAGFVWDEFNQLFNWEKFLIYDNVVIRITGLRTLKINTILAKFLYKDF